MAPEQFPQRILIVVSGMSPQVLTETLHALLHQQPAFVPTEIHLVSTLGGARHARLSLLEGDAHFLRLCQDYGVDPGIFDAGRIHVIRDATDRVLDDIRTPADNDAAADFITALIQQHTSRSDAAVHVSMAGGRKTMGYYAGYALSLFGRDQDRLSHVLVSEGYEGHRDFFYPTPRSHAIYRDGGPALDASEAKVELASIPFVRLRDQLQQDVLARDPLLSGQQGFSACIAAAEWARQSHVITLDMQQLDFRIGDRSLQPLGTAQLALMCWLALRQANGLPPLEMREVELDGKQLGREFARLCEQLSDTDQHLKQLARDEGRPAVLILPEIDKVTNALGSAGFRSRDDFDYRRTNLNNALVRMLGNQLAQQFALQNYGRRGKSCYGFTDFEQRFTLVPP